VSGESRRGGEGKMLEDLEKQVLKIYETCVGENRVNKGLIEKTLNLSSNDTEKYR
jgi:hypothetical protein